MQSVDIPSNSKMFLFTWKMCLHSCILFLAMYICRPHIYIIVSCFEVMDQYLHKSMSRMCGEEISCGTVTNSKHQHVLCMYYVRAETEQSSCNMFGLFRTVCLPLLWPNFTSSETSRTLYNRLPWADGAWSHNMVKQSAGYSHFVQTLALACFIFILVFVYLGR